MRMSWKIVGWVLVAMVISLFIAGLSGFLYNERERNEVWKQVTKETTFEARIAKIEVSTVRFSGRDHFVLNVTLDRPVILKCISWSDKVIHSYKVKELIYQPSFEAANQFQLVKLVEDWEMGGNISRWRYKAIERDHGFPVLAQLYPELDK